VVDVRRGIGGSVGVIPLESSGRIAQPYSSWTKRSARPVPARPTSKSLQAGYQLDGRAANPVDMEVMHDATNAEH
jgi:hypothetical protein